MWIKENSEKRGTQGNNSEQKAAGTHEQTFIKRRKKRMRLGKLRWRKKREIMRSEENRQQMTEQEAPGRHDWRFTKKKKKNEN